MRRLLPALVAFVLTVAALVTSALSLPQHGDEKMYIWKAGYYGGLLARLDTRTEMRNEYRDPGWSPHAFWAYEQPLGSHWLYALVLGVTRTSPPVVPYSWSDPTLQGPETAIPQATLAIVRLAAVCFAALGLALIVYRLRWPAVVAVILFLVIPDVRDDLARAWAEGPLLLGLGLAVISFGTPWFAVACAVAASFKLTALLLWPVAVWRGLGTRLPHLSAFVVLALTFTLLDPPSWLAGGPSYLVTFLSYRFFQQQALSASYGGPGGFFLPTRYLWPFELAGLLTLCVFAPKVWRRLHHPANCDPTPTTVA